MKQGESIAGSCRRENARCRACGHIEHVCSRFKELRRCPNCASSELEKVFWWYGMPLPAVVLGKRLADGRKVVPKFFVEVHANLNPVAGGDSFLSWLAAEGWFRSQGWEMVDNAEWEEYSERIEESGTGKVLCFKKWF
ncbi:hypothetical protein KJ866_03005 [Patescibacteria group bacterium]|nr:hypothetical protein [Patescibacteria group bacterium]